MSKEAMQLGLAAMEYMAKIRNCQREQGFPLSDADKRMQVAITALSEALSVIKQEEYQTKSIRYDLSPAMVEGVIRDKLIEMGWTQPSQTTRMTPDHVRETLAVPVQAAPVPEGWKLGGPITEAMHEAACKVLTRANGLDGTPQRMLDAMLAAAPAPQAEQPAIGDIRALKHRIHELEGDVIGYKQMLDLAEGKLQAVEQHISAGPIRPAMMMALTTEQKQALLAMSAPSPQPAQQEPVAVIGSGFQLLWCREDWSKGLKVGDALYTAPPAQRPWVGLTDEEILDMADGCTAQFHDLLEFGRNTEFKLREKNAAQPQPLTTTNLKRVINAVPMPSNSDDVGRWVVNVCRAIEAAHGITPSGKGESCGHETCDYRSYCKKQYPKQEDWGCGPHEYHSLPAFNHEKEANKALRDAQNRSYEIAKEYNQKRCI